MASLPPRLTPVTGPLIKVLESTALLSAPLASTEKLYSPWLAWVPPVLVPFHSASLYPDLSWPSSISFTAFPEGSLMIRVAELASEPSENPSFLGAQPYTKEEDSALAFLPIREAEPNSWSAFMLPFMSPREVFRFCMPSSELN